MENFSNELSIAETKGYMALKDAFLSIFDETKNDFFLITGLSSALLQKVSQHAAIPSHKTLCDFYQTLFELTEIYTENHFTEDGRTRHSETA